MRKSVCKESHKRFSPVLAVYPFKRLIVNDFCRLLFSLSVFTPEHGILDILTHHFTHNGRIAAAATESVEEIRIIQMRLKLAYIAVELINATFVGSRT